MTILEEINQKLRTLPPEKLKEILDFITFVQFRMSNTTKIGKKQSLRQHPAFGSWRERNIDALEYQRNLRAEWDNS